MCVCLCVHVTCVLCSHNPLLLTDGDNQYCPWETRGRPACYTTHRDTQTSTHRREGL
ncbi:hypothetical protein Q5P01_003877 [Channa striata]|uniref:Uncharacterized protein n=1 Tax=Channa striata TaxID=64152 RepID=A0AA88NKF4_CHASR|nr:hypothetical protein Q5P01_003877 [Channa striata]